MPQDDQHGISGRRWNRGQGIKQLKRGHVSLNRAQGVSKSWGEHEVIQRKRGEGTEMQEEWTYMDWILRLGKEQEAAGVAVL